MLPCSTFIPNICQAVQLREEGEAEGAPELSPEHSSLEKKETEVIVTDVTSVKVDLLCDDKRLNVPSEVTKVLTTFKPDSPDVTKAAKKFEKDKIVDICDTDSDEVFVISGDTITNEQVDFVSEEELGAISKISKR